MSVSDHDIGRLWIQVDYLRRQARNGLADALAGVLTEHEQLREGLRQIIEGDFPSDAGNAETWASEVLGRPEAVQWEREPSG